VFKNFENVFLPVNAIELFFPNLLYMAFIFFHLWSLPGTSCPQACISPAIIIFTP